VEIEPLLKQANDVDTARKFSVYDLFMFLAEAALGQWKGYRDGAGKWPLHPFKLLLSADLVIA